MKTTRTRLLLFVLPLAFLGLGFTAYLVRSGDAAPAAAVEGPLPDDSIYQLGSTWYDQQGQLLPLSALRGRPRLVAMIFTRCGYACPRIVNDLKQILARVPERERAALGLVLVSIDPDHDTSTALADFSRAHRLDASQWTMLRGAETDVRTMAAVLGVRYKEESEGLFAHSNLITLLDADGRVVYRQEGLGADPSALLDAIAGL